MARQVRQPLSPQQRRRRIIMWTVGVVGGLVLLLVIAALVLYMQTTGQPPMPRDALTGIEQGGDSASVTTLAQIAQLQYAIKQGRRQRVDLQLTNADVARLISLEGPTGAVQDPQVYFGSGRVIARGRPNVDRDRGPHLQAAITLSVSEGQLQGAITEMWLGSIGAPASLRQYMQQALDRELARQTPQRLGVYVETISIEPGRATITGYTMGR